MIDTKDVPNILLKDSAWVMEEVEQQPEMWMETFEIVKSRKEELAAFLEPGYDIILSGAGSSEYIGNMIVRELNLIEDRNFVSVGTPDIVTHPSYYFRKTQKTILVSFSRGGNSPETMGTIQHADKLIDDVKHLFFTCNPNGKMMEYARNNPKVMVFMMPQKTFDRSYAMTSSVTCMALACYLSFHLDKLDEMEKHVSSAAALGKKILSENSTALKELVHVFPFEKFVALGSGTLKGLAQEAEIKVMEVSAGRLGTRFDTIPGFRHGPLAVVRAGKNALTVIFYENSDYVNQYADDMLKEIKRLGQGFNRVLAVTPRRTDIIEEFADEVVFLDDQTLPEVFLSLPMSIVMHLIMIYRAWEYGLGADFPFSRGNIRGIKTITYPI